MQVLNLGFTWTLTLSALRKHTRQTLNGLNPRVISLNNAGL